MKKNVKVFLLFLLTFLLVFAAGCGKNKTPEQTAQSSSVTVTELTEAPDISSETPTPENTPQEQETQVPEQTAEAPLTDEPSPEVTDEPSPEVTDESTPEVTQEPAPEVTDEPTPEVTQEPETDPTAVVVEEDGEYTDKEHVALYLHTYGHLPSNYVTKQEARAAGWDSGAGNLITVLPGKSIGGDKFGNYEGLLPEAKGRKYYECDINFNPKGKTSGRVSRGPERIIYSSDGLIFYTGDHYETFEQLY